MSKKSFLNNTGKKWPLSAARVIPDPSITTCYTSPSRRDDIFHNQHLQAYINSYGSYNHMGI
jgi:hypothetical protein